MTRITIVRPAYLTLLAVSFAFYAVWRIWRPPMPDGRSRLALALRLVLVTLLVLALADVRVQRQPQGRAVVAVVDLSDSARTSVAAATEAVREMLEGKAADDLFGIVTFGRDTQVEVPLSRNPIFSNFQTMPDGSYSNLGGALELAANVIPDGYGRQVVLMSDGRQNLGDAARTVAALRDRSVRVDVIPMGRPAGAESLVTALDAPPELRSGQSLTLAARLRSTGPTPARLVLRLDGREVETRSIDLPAGDSVHPFSLEGVEPGLRRVAVALDAQSDGFSENNVAEAVVRVLGRPSVLILEGGPGKGANVTAALVASGMDVQTRSAAEAPTDLAVIARHDSVVIVDAPAAAFPAGALDAIGTSVRGLGHGLVAIGGPRSYGPGGWQDTPLEATLPVRMELPQPNQRPSVAVALVMETMETLFGDGVALGAAEAVIDNLRPDDEVTVINMSTAPPGGQQTGVPAYIVPLTRPIEADGIKRRIRFTELGDPPGYTRSLNLALDTLDTSSAAVKHILIIGDGDATADGHEYDPLFVTAKSRNVTISSIGVDTHSDAGFMANMRTIAERGGGIFYQSNSANNVPDVLLEASQTALRPWFEQQPFFPEVTSAGDLLDGVDLSAFPAVDGYVVTSPKSTADILLSSPKRDPLLVAGQVGVGRSVAWTSDADGRWTDELLKSSVSATLFGRMVAWSLPTSAGNELQLDVVPRPEGLDLEVSGPETGGEMHVQVIPPSQGVTSERLLSSGPGRWQGLVAAGEVGTYVLHAVLTRAGVTAGQTEVFFPVPYSPEYLDLGRDHGLLGALAGQGGAILRRPADVWSRPLPPLSVAAPLFWLMLLAVAVLWPADIALRRLGVDPTGLLASVRSRIWTLYRWPWRHNSEVIGDLLVVKEVRHGAANDELSASEKDLTLATRLVAARRSRCPEKASDRGSDGDG